MDSPTKRNPYIENLIHNKKPAKKIIKTDCRLVYQQEIVEDTILGEIDFAFFFVTRKLISSREIYS